MISSACQVAQRLLERHGRELVGRDVREVTHPEDVWANSAAIRESLETGEPRALLKRYSRPDGSFVLARMFGVFLRDDRGRVTHGEGLITPVCLDSLADPGTLGPMPRQLKAYRVSVNKPRKGRDRGKWRLRIRGEGVDTHELTELDWCPATLAHAEHLAAVREAELNEETPPRPPPELDPPPTVGEVLDAYVRWCYENQASGTALFSRNAAKWAERSGLADVPADRLTKRALAEARDCLFRGVKGNTAAGYWSRWRQAWEWALERELVDEPLPPVRRRRLGPGDRTQKRALTDAEALDLLTYAETYAGGRYHLLLWCLAETGSRIGDLGRLEVADFYWDGPGHGARLRFVQKGNTHRHNWISPPLASRVSAEVIAGRSSGRLWRAARGGAIKDSSVEPLMTSWRRDRGLLGQVDTHSLRRYAVARLEDRGVAQAAGMKVTGHHSAAIYARYAAKGHYDLLAASAALWLTPGPPSPVSPRSATVEPQTQRGPELTGRLGFEPITLETPQLRGLEARGVPVCPLLQDFLSSREGRILEAREALGRSLEAVT